MNDYIINEVILNKIKVYFIKNGEMIIGTLTGNKVNDKFELMTIDKTYHYAYQYQYKIYEKKGE